jgi:hypothetical protein
MRPVQAEPTDPVGAGDAPPVYRVRFWSPPPGKGFAWSVSEWDVTEAEQVTDVIEWAAGTADGNPFEVFLRWQDHHTSKDGQTAAYPRYALIYGRPADENPTTETVFFEKQ